MQQVKAKTTLLASLLRIVKRDAAKDVTIFVIILRFKEKLSVLIDHGCQMAIDILQKNVLFCFKPKENQRWHHIFMSENC